MQAWQRPENAPIAARCSPRTVECRSIAPRNVPRQQRKPRRKGKVFLLLEFHHRFNCPKEIPLSFLLGFLCCRGTFLGAILLHSAVRGEHLAAMGTFSGLCHACNYYGFNISFVVPLRKSSQVNLRHSLLPFATMFRFSKSEQESVNSCNPSETLVNSVHDVAKIKPRKFPAVEIRCKFIGNFRSNQKRLPKC